MRVRAATKTPKYDEAKPPMHSCPLTWAPGYYVRKGSYVAYDVLVLSLPTKPSTLHSDDPIPHVTCWFQVMSNDTLSLPASPASCLYGQWRRRTNPVRFEP
jgi:hypothetical protein